MILPIFYGIPTLRVRYAIALAKLIEILANQISSWSVTTLAAAEEAVKDIEYAEKTLAANRLEKKFLSDSLARLNLGVYPSVANFLFLELPQSSFAAEEMRSYLIKNHGIIIRDCLTYSGLEATRCSDFLSRFRRVKIRCALKFKKGTHLMKGACLFTFNRHLD